MFPQATFVYLSNDPHMYSSTDWLASWAKKTAIATRTIYTPILYALYNLQPGNGLSPILTAPEATQGNHLEKDCIITHTISQPITHTPNSLIWCTENLTISAHWLCNTNNRIHTSIYKLLQQAAPFLTKQVCASQTAVTANAHQVSDALLQQIERSTKASLMLPKVFTTCTSNYRSTLPQNTQQKK